MDLLLIPFLVTTVFVPLIFKYLAPLFSGGKVRLQKTNLAQYALLGVTVPLMAFAFFIIVIIATAFCFSNVLNDLDAKNPEAMQFVTFLFRFVLLQMGFFLSTLFAGKFLSKALHVESKMAALRASVALTAVAALFGFAVNLYVNSTVR